MKRLFKGENGQVLIVVALLMTIFMGIAAFALDTGILYIEKGRLQKVTDAAVLAGSTELPSNPAKAQEEAIRTIELNKETPSKFTISIENTNRTMVVSGRKEVKLVFAPFLGFKVAQVQSVSRTIRMQLASAKGAVPLGVQEALKLSFGQQVKLKVSQGEGGNFGALALSGTGASDYENDLTRGYEKELRIGQTIGIKTGNVAGPTKRAVDTRIAACPNDTYLTYKKTCERIVLVPVYRITSSEQRLIVGFAAFFLESVGSTSEGAPVIGRFIEYAYPGDYIESSAEYGAYRYKLVR